MHAIPTLGIVWLPNGSSSTSHEKKTKSSSDHITWKWRKLSQLYPISVELSNLINLFAEQDKHLSKVNTTTQIVVQARLLLMKKKAKSSSDHITWNTKCLYFVNILGVLLITEALCQDSKKLYCIVCWLLTFPLSSSPVGQKNYETIFALVLLPLTGSVCFVFESSCQVVRYWWASCLHAIDMVCLLYACFSG